MTPSFYPAGDAFSELSADRAVFGDDADRGAGRPSFGLMDAPVSPEELISAALYITAARPPEALPATLRARLIADSQAFASDAIIAPLAAPAPVDVNQRWLGGVLALAASIALAAGILWPKSEAPTPPVAARMSFLKSHPEVTPIAWTTTEDPAAQGASGDVVWSDEAQQGYMTFSGLPANDPAVTQYQLWVFDAARDERYPVDGGVFDVPSGEEVAVVPIATKLPVSRATMFAVTIEPAGGVVVSDRSRLPLLAKTDSNS